MSVLVTELLGVLMNSQVEVEGVRRVDRGVRYTVQPGAPSVDEIEIVVQRRPKFYTPRGG